MIGTGGWAARSMGWASDPSISTSSSCTTLTTIWPGVTDFTTSWPTALARTLSVNDRTTSSATSASSNARRTSRMASATSLSVSAPRRVSLSRMPERRSDRDWNIRPHRREVSLRANPKLTSSREGGDQCTLPDGIGQLTGTPSQRASQGHPAPCGEVSWVPAFAGMTHRRGNRQSHPRAQSAGGCSPPGLPIPPAGPADHVQGGGSFPRAVWMARTIVEVGAAVNLRKAHLRKAFRAEARAEGARLKAGDARSAQRDVRMFTERQQPCRSPARSRC